MLRFAALSYCPASQPGPCYVSAFGVSSSPPGGCTMLYEQGKHSEGAGTAVSGRSNQRLPPPALEAWPFHAKGPCPPCTVLRGCYPVLQALPCQPCRLSSGLLRACAGQGHVLCRRQGCLGLSSPQVCVGRMPATFATATAATPAFCLCPGAAACATALNGARAAECHRWCVSVEKARCGATPLSCMLHACAVCPPQAHS